LKKVYRISGKDLKLFGNDRSLGRGNHLFFSLNGGKKGGGFIGRDQRKTCISWAGLGKTMVIVLRGNLTVHEEFPTRQREGVRKGKHMFYAFERGRKKNAPKKEKGNSCKLSATGVGWNEFQEISEVENRKWSEGGGGEGEGRRRKENSLWPKRSWTQGIYSLRVGGGGYKVGDLRFGGKEGRRVEKGWQ